MLPGRYALWCAVVVTGELSLADARRHRESISSIRLIYDYTDRLCHGTSRVTEGRPGDGGRACADRERRRYDRMFPPGSTNLPAQTGVDPMAGEAAGAKKDAPAAALEHRGIRVTQARGAQSALRTGAGIERG